MRHSRAEVRWTGYRDRVGHSPETSPVRILQNDGRFVHSKEYQRRVADRHAPTIHRPGRPVPAIAGGPLASLPPPSKRVALSGFRTTFCHSERIELRGALVGSGCATIPSDSRRKRVPAPSERACSLPIDPRNAQSVNSTHLSPDRRDHRQARTSSRASRGRTRPAAKRHSRDARC